MSLDRQTGSSMRPVFLTTLHLALFIYLETYLIWVESCCIYNMPHELFRCNYNASKMVFSGLKLSLTPYGSGEVLVRVSCFVWCPMTPDLTWSSHVQISNLPTVHMVQIVTKMKQREGTGTIAAGGTGRFRRGPGIYGSC